MNTTLYANPVCHPSGFYFESAEEFQAKYDENYAKHGTEEYEIDYVEGQNPQLFEAAGINQANIEFFFDEVDDFSDDSVEAVAIRFLTDVIGLTLEEAIERHEEVNIYHGSAVEYAQELVDDCYDLPEFALRYFDFEAFARDLELNGDINEVDNGWYVTNPQDF